MFKRTLLVAFLLVALLSLMSFNATATTTDTTETTETTEDPLAEYRMYEGVYKRVTLNGDGKNAVCIFTPTYTDVYNFTSDSAYGDTYAALFLYSNGEPITLATDDDSGVGNNFRISYELIAGETYMLGSRFYSSYTSGSYNVIVTSSHTHNFEMTNCEQGPVCTVCGLQNGEPQEHVYDNDCDADCNTCGTVREPNHAWQNGTCTEAPTCAACGTIGVAPGHTYTDACDASCDVCNEERVAPHEYAPVLVPATTAADGYSASKCNLCGHETEQVVIPKLGTISLSATSYTYNGKTQKPSVVVKDSQGNTIAASDYTVTYSSGCKNAGTYQVTVTFTGNYSGSETLTYTINKQSVSKLSISLSKTKYTYNGKTQKPSVTVKDSKGNKISSSNYTVSYSSGCKNAGTYKVTVTFKGNYTGKKTLTYTIGKQSDSKVTVKLSTTKLAYTGKTQRPSLTLKDSNGNTLKYKRDYTISYRTDRKSVGKHTIKITYKGNYSGSETVSYTIAPTVKTSLKGYIGDTFKIGAKSDEKITYSSSNKKIATVSSKGVITAKKAGTVTISVKSGGVTQKITVKISTPSIKLSSDSSMYIGESQKITAKTSVKGKVTWSVSNSKIAKISSSGKLTALKEGTVTVTAKLTYKGHTYKKTCKVKISVEYPDISVFISSTIDYTSSYAMIITNDSSRSLKVLNRGWVYCDGDSADVVSLFGGSGNSYNYYKSITISPDSSSSFVMCLDEKMVLLKSKPTYAYIYVEYGGELFKLSCSTNRYGLNKCHTITWIKD